MLVDAEDGGEDRQGGFFVLRKSQKKIHISCIFNANTYWRQVGMEQSIGWSTEHILVFRCEWMREAASLYLLLVKTEENH